MARLAGLTDFELVDSELGDVSLSVPLPDDYHLTVQGLCLVDEKYGMTRSDPDGEMLHYPKMKQSEVVTEIKRLIA